MGLSLLCSGEWRTRIRHLVVLCFKVAFTLHDGDAVDGYPPVGSIQSHVYKLQSCCLVMLMCPDWYALYNPHAVDMPSAVGAMNPSSLPPRHYISSSSTIGSNLPLNLPPLLISTQQLIRNLRHLHILHALRNTPFLLIKDLLNNSQNIM